MLDLVKTHVVHRRMFYFGALCLVSTVVALQWQFKPIRNLNSEAFLREISKSAYVTTTVSSSSSTDKISCERLIEGDVGEIERANTLLKKQFRRSYLPEVYPSLTKNCSFYVSTRGYINFTVNKEEESFPLAFSLVVYKHAEQVELLLRAIWRPHNVYCIHIDKKATNNFKEAIKSIAKCFKNVFILPVSINVVWGTYTVLEPELLCMDLLSNKTQKWKYFINLTGQELPLKTNYEMYLILSSYNGSNDIEGTYKNANRDRWQGVGDPPHKIQPRKGSVHIAASRDYVNYLLHNKTSLDLLEWIKKTRIPDETYFATLNYNPHLKVPGSYTGAVDDGKRGGTMNRHKIWYDKKKCTGKFVRGICIFSVGDLPRLTQSKALFANKFHFEYDYLAYDCLERWYNGKVLKERQGYVLFNTSVYKRRWIVNHHF